MILFGHCFKCKQQEPVHFETKPSSDIEKNIDVMLNNKYEQLKYIINNKNNCYLYQCFPQRAIS